MRTVGLLLAANFAVAAALAATLGSLDVTLLSFASLYLALKLAAILTPASHWQRGWVRWMVVVGNATATSVAILAIVKAA